MSIGDQGIILWNNIASHMSMSCSVNTWKKKLKTTCLENSKCKSTWLDIDKKTIIIFMKDNNDVKCFINFYFANRSPLSHKN